MKKTQITAIAFAIVLTVLGGMALAQQDKYTLKVLAVGAALSIAAGLIAVGLIAWYDWRPLTDKERARLRS
jgi:hypothetical protein